MRIKIVALLFIFSLTACHSGHKAPKGILPKEKMIEVLVDFQLTEAAVLQKQNHQQDIKFYTNYYYNYVLKKHQISRKEFKESLDWYNHNPEEMDKMYQETLGRLSKMKIETKK